MKQLISVLMLVMLFACSQPNEHEYQIIGMVTVVGHEPFAGLALRLDNNKAVLLECEDNIENELLALQGHRVIIFYEESWVENGSQVVRVKRYDEV